MLSDPHNLISLNTSNVYAYNNRYFGFGMKLSINNDSCFFQFTL